MMLFILSSIVVLVILIAIPSLYSHYKMMHLSENDYQYYNAYFSSRFRYYHLLENWEKRKFISRVLYIKSRKSIYGREGMIITEDVTLLFSAAFVQITFGFTNFELEKFDEIYIYPETFYSQSVGAEVRGLTSNDGQLFLSWEHFINGYLYENDKINLALHELAHALHIQYFKHNLNLDWNKWLKIAEVEMEKMKTSSEENYFRKYAETNIQEFWAVCVEYFFEVPVMFKEKRPQLYAATGNVLKQDMAARVLKAISNDKL